MDRILIVDDAELNRFMLRSMFDNEFEVLEAGDGEEAISIIERLETGLSLIILDYMMPKKNGLDVLEYMKRTHLEERIPVIMITGESSSETVEKAYEYGVADVILKPFSKQIVSRRAKNLIEQYRSREQIEAELASKTKELRESQARLASFNEYLLEALGSVVEFRSLESGDHVKRVKQFTAIMLKIAKEQFPKYQLTNEQIRLASMAAILHDVGKLAVSDSILNAPRRLTVEEFEEMKKHTSYGCEIIERFKELTTEFFQYAYEICRWHHEKVDGRGYPDGLKGDEIPIYCQAVSVADCFDALISKRVYKDAISCEEAYQMIRRGECGAFSEDIMRCFELAKEEMMAIVLQVQEGLIL